MHTRIRRLGGIACALLLTAIAAGSALSWHAAPRPVVAAAVVKPEVFVAPTGSPTAPGTLSDPLDLPTALSGSVAAIGPGTTVWLRAGIYGVGGATVFASRLTGTQNSPVLVRQYPGERATVNGGIAAYGAWTTFHGFEITNTSPQRSTDQSRRPPGLELFGRGHRAINMIVHNTGHPGIGFWSTVGDGGEISGCILWGNGLYDVGSGSNPWTRGSAIYAQNESGTRLIRDVISFRNFTTGMKAYAEHGYVNGFRFEGNTVFDNGAENLFVGSLRHPIDRLAIVDNYAYRRSTDGGSSVQLGYAGRDNQALVANNYLVSGGTSAGALSLHAWSTTTVTGNTLVGGDVLAALTTSAAAADWNHNAYHAGDDQPFRYAGGAYLFDAWQASTGNDRDSRYARDYPSEPRVFVRPNAYEPGRAHITVFNWSRSRSASVDVSGVLPPGARYDLIDAQNYFGGPVGGGVFTGARIVLPLNLVEVAPLTGDVDHLHNKHTAPEFAVFVLRQSRAGTPPPTSNPTWLPLVIHQAR